MDSVNSAGDFTYIEEKDKHSSISISEKSSLLKDKSIKYYKTPMFDKQKGRFNNNLMSMLDQIKNNPLKDKRYSNKINQVNLMNNYQNVRCKTPVITRKLNSSNQNISREDLGQVYSNLPSISPSNMNKNKSNQELNKSNHSFVNTSKSKKKDNIIKSLAFKDSVNYSKIYSQKTSQSKVTTISTPKYINNKMPVNLKANNNETINNNLTTEMNKDNYSNNNNSNNLNINVNNVNINVNNSITGKDLNITTKFANEDRKFSILDIPSNVPLIMEDQILKSIGIYKSIIYRE